MMSCRQCSGVLYFVGGKAVPNELLSEVLFKEAVTFFTQQQQQMIYFFIFPTCCRSSLFLLLGGVGAVIFHRFGIYFS